MKKFIQVTFSLIFGFVLNLNSVFAVGFVSVDKFKLINQNNELMANITCSRLSYDESQTIFQNRGNRNSEIVVDSLIIKAKSLTMVFVEGTSSTDEETLIINDNKCGVEI